MPNLPRVIDSKYTNLEYELEKLAHISEVECSKFDIALGQRLMEVGRIFSQIPTHKRNFRIFRGIKDFSFRNLEAAIALSKIPNIKTIYDFGWKKLYYLYINSRGLNYSNISLESIAKEFGGINEETVEKGIIKAVLKLKKFNFNLINDYWNKGLRLWMLSDKGNIKKIQESGNITKTIIGIINRFEKKNKVSKEDDYEYYQNNLIQGTKAINAMYKTAKYDYIVDIKILINDIRAAKKLLKRIIPIYKQERKNVQDNISDLLN